MEGVLVGEFGMPEEAFQGRNHVLVNMGLQCLYLSPLTLYLLDEIPILSEELANCLNSTQGHFRLQCHHNFDGRPSFPIIYLPKVQ